MADGLVRYGVFSVERREFGFGMGELDVRRSQDVFQWFKKDSVELAETDPVVGILPVAFGLSTDIPFKTYHRSVSCRMPLVLSLMLTSTVSQQLYQVQSRPRRRSKHAD